MFKAFRQKYLTPPATQRCIHDALSSRRTILNTHPRDVADKHLVYTLKDVKEGEVYKFVGGVKAEHPKVKRGAAMLQLTFLDAKGEALTSEQHHGLSYSRKAGYYHYLNHVSQTTSPTTVVFLVPPKCTTVRLKLRPWKVKDKPVRLTAGTCVECVSTSSEAVDVAILNDFYAAYPNGNVGSDKNAGVFAHDTAQTYGITPHVVAETIFTDIVKNNSLHASYVAATAFAGNNKEYLYEAIYESYRHAGSITRMREFLDEAIKSGLCDPDSSRVRKNAEDNAYLTEGFTVAPVKRERPLYTPKGVILCVLHHALPHHTDAYAVRRHGLLKHAAAISSYNVVGLTPPGCPTHSKNSDSLTLPESLPASCDIEGITYNISDQDVQRHSMSVSDYVHDYTSVICAEAEAHNACSIHIASDQLDALAAVRAARITGIPSIYEIRSPQEIYLSAHAYLHEQSDQYIMRSRLEIQAAQEADMVVVSTEGFKKNLEERGVSTPIYVVPDGVDTHIFKPIEQDSDTDTRLSFGDNIVIGCVMTPAHDAGVQDILLATADVYARHGMKHINVLVIGESDRQEHLKRLAQEYGISRQVMFVGAVEHRKLAAYLSYVDIMPFSSQSQASLNTADFMRILEAAACGKTVVCDDSDAAAEIMKDGQTCLMFRKNDAKNFTDTLAKVITSEHLRLTLGNNARHYVREGYTQHMSSQHIADIYRKAFEKSRRHIS